jgi:hypothetical protein
MVEVTVGDAVVVSTFAARVGGGVDAVGAAVFVTTTEILEAVTPLVGLSVAPDSGCGVAFEALLWVADVGAVDEAVAVGEVLLVELSGPEVAAVGSVLLVPAVLVTDVFAPPEAWTTGVDGSVVDRVDVGEVPEGGVVAVLPRSAVDDVESLDDVLLDESVDADPVVSASAIAETLVIANPKPSATAKAPTRPTWLA